MQPPLQFDSPTSRWVILGYLALIATAHEYGYWDPFHVQLLEHVGFRDLGKLALTPVLGTMAVYVVQLFAGRDWPLWPARNPSTPTAPTTTPIFQGRLRFIPLVLPIIAVAWGAGSREIVGEELWVPLGLIPAAVGIAVILGDHPAFKNLDGYVRLVIAMLPVVVFANAGSRADRILEGTEFLEATLPGESGERRYIGRVGDYIFLYEPKERRTELRALAAAQPLQLRHVQRDQPEAHVTPQQAGKQDPKAQSH